ncbi:PREDICTED: uncharacterized protein LOC109183825 [Ipomoea nil]|uniref:uncharacterized protein LOC109183825 n=1 Tax=Ipomoea nil TaxID=35883 RepID=UPI000901DB3A|nr:PREDICTED: uncharacterized protein LOC109183825 [Ipomoea nil]
MWTRLSKGMLEMVVVVAWAIWEARNALVWNQKGTNPNSLVQQARSCAINWQMIAKGNDQHDDTILGEVMFAKEGMHTVREAEAMGTREALSWIKEKGWKRVILETDALIVTQAVAGGNNISPFGSIIEDIRELMRQLPMVCFRFVPRRKNMVAHTLAKHALNCVGTQRIELYDYIPRFLPILVSKNTAST